MVRALLWVETDSQKGILIGAGGKMIKAIGTAARRELERELGAQVHLDLSVRVRRAWRGDDGLLDRLGIDSAAAPGTFSKFRPFPERNLDHGPWVGRRQD